MIDREVALNDGNTMPRLGYGVWQLSDKQAGTLVADAIAAGFRHIDTAQAYSYEDGVGRAVRSAGIPRAELFVTSKLRGRHMGFEEAKRSFEGSLERLGLDYLDLFLVHWPMPRRDRYVETWKALVELKAEGRVRSIGVSNFTPEHIDRLVRETGVVPAVNQIEAHLLFQQRDIREHHRRNGIAIESYSPFGGSGASVLRQETVRSIAARHGRTPAQVVLRWHLQEGLVPLPKTATEARIPENLAVWDFALDDADMAGLARLDRPHGNTQPHPDDMNSPF